MSIIDEKYERNSISKGQQLSCPHLTLLNIHLAITTFYYTQVFTHNQRRNLAILRKLGWDIKGEQGGIILTWGKRQGSRRNSTGRFKSIWISKMNKPTLSSRRMLQNEETKRRYLKSFDDSKRNSKQIKKEN